MQKHILYSFRRCPYAIRARWALAICGISVQIREVDLKNKPIELTEISKTNTVPLLVLGNGEIIEESLDIIIWAIRNKRDSYFQENKRDEIINLIKENDDVFKFHLDRFKYSSRFDENKKEFHFQEAQKIITKWNKTLKKDSTANYWLIGTGESIADWCLWPFIRQFKIACEVQKRSKILDTPIRLWLDYFENHKNFKKVMHKYSPWESSSTPNFFPFN